MNDIDYAGKTELSEKPEHMTHLRGNVLVDKSAAVIRLRGKIDSLTAEIVLLQTGLGPTGLLSDLDELLDLLRRLMRAEVTQSPLGGYSLMGLDENELRRHSHQCRTIYGVPAMHSPSRQDGAVFAQLNLLRAHAREAELAAAQALRDGMLDRELLVCLNRISSALHVMMCREMSGYYAK